MNVVGTSYVLVAAAALFLDFGCKLVRILDRRPQPCFVICKITGRRPTFVRTPLSIYVYVTNNLYSLSEHRGSEARCSQFREYILLVFHSDQNKVHEE
jgi:hypothetical protein